MARTVFVPPAQWRHLLRASLRECSYLPDPIARGYMHDYILQRYRRFAPKGKKPENLDIRRQSRLRRAAKHTLSVLQRANEGYLKPLERVLQLSYGRIGKRRHELLEPLLTPEVPKDKDAVTDMIKQPPMFDEGWQPPKIVTEILKSQLQNGLVVRTTVRPLVKNLQPKIPEENAWGRPLARCRRRNIRKRWYHAALDSILPPLPEDEVKILEGLLSGTHPWEPVKRRKALSGPSSAQGFLDAKFLAVGPPKGHTFEKYVNGRPHKITRRLMQGLWEQISILVPRMKWDESKNKWLFEWGSPKRGTQLAAVMDQKHVPDLFRGVDDKGKLIRLQNEKKQKQKAAA